MERYQSSIHCFCWMTNHLHMVIQVDDKPLAATIRYAASQYSRKEFPGASLNYLPHENVDIGRGQTELMTSTLVGPKSNIQVCVGRATFRPLVQRAGTY
jgi:hypothetical protein